MRFIEGGEQEEQDDNLDLNDDIVDMWVIRLYTLSGLLIGDSLHI